MGSGPVGVSPELAQRNSIEIFLNTMESAIRAARTFGDSPQNKSLENVYSNLIHALRNCFLESEEAIELEIKGPQIIFQKRPIYENRDKKKSLSLLLQDSGIRVLRLRREFFEEDLRVFLKLLQTDFSLPQHMDEDLYCLIKERELVSIEVFSDDLLKDRQMRDPEFGGIHRAFVESLQSKCRLASAPMEPRRLRNDDLKVLEEFRLSPAQFNRTDEEVARIVKSISVQHGNSETATLERLALMGFHFLLQEGENDQIQVGRNLVQQVAQMSLEERHVSLFSALLRKLFQLHKERDDRRGEIQKVLDQVFSVANEEVFRELLDSGEYQREAVKLLLSAPPSGVRLIIVLLEAQSWMPKTFSEFIHQHLPEQMAWLEEEVEKRPEDSLWEHVINILSQKPNPQFSRFVIKAYETAGPSVRLKILRQCAEISTPDSLRLFQKQLLSECRESREMVYSSLPNSSSPMATQLLQKFIDSDAFETLEAEERELAYAAMLKLVQARYSEFFMREWMKAGSGFFKSKQINERRVLLLKAAHRAKLDTIDFIFEKTPRESLSSDLLKWIELFEQKRGEQDV